MRRDALGRVHGRLPLGLVEVRTPDAAHVLGTAEARLDLPGQRRAEKSGQAITHARVEDGGVDLQGAFDQRRQPLPVRPGRQPAGRHLVEFDVAVGDALLLQVAEGTQEVVAEPLQELERNGAELAQTLGQRALGGIVEEQAGVTEDVVGLVVGDDGLMPQLFQGLRFLAQALVVLGSGGQFEHALLPALHDDESDRAGPAPEALGHQEAALEGVTGARRGGIGAALAVGAAELVLDQVEILDEFTDRTDATAGVRVGGVVDEVLQLAAGTVLHIGDLQPLAAAELVLQLQIARGGRPAGKEQVGDGAEREDIESDAVARVGPQRIGMGLEREIRAGLLLEDATQVAECRQCPRFALERAPRGGPIGDLDGAPAVTVVAHIDALRAQRSMLDALKQSKLQLGGVAQGGGLLLGLAKGEIDADAPLHARFRVGGEPVLEVIRLIEQRSERVESNAPRAQGFFDAGLLKGARDDLGDRPVERTMLPTAVDAAERIHDVPAGTHLKARRPQQLVDDVVGGQEDQRLDEGDALLRLQRRALALEQGFELLGLTIGQQARIVEDATAPLVGPDPGVGVAAELAGVRLDLDEEEPLGGQDEVVDLVDGTVVRDEFKVSPGAVRLMVG